MSIIDLALTIASQEFLRPIKTDVCAVLNDPHGRSIRGIPDLKIRGDLSCYLTTRSIFFTEINYYRYIFFNYRAIVIGGI